MVRRDQRRQRDDRLHGQPAVQKPVPRGERLGRIRRRDDGHGVGVGRVQHPAQQQRLPAQQDAVRGRGGLLHIGGGHALRQGAVGDVALPQQRKRGSAAAQDQPLAAGVRLPYPGADRVGPTAQIARAAPGIVLGGKGVLQPTDIALVLQNRLFLQRVQPFPERPARQPAARQRHCQRECKDSRVHGCTLHKVTSCGFPVV